MFNFKKFFRKKTYDILQYNNEPNVNFSKFPISVTENFFENLIRAIINFDNDQDRFLQFKQAIKQLNHLNMKSLNDLYNLQSNKLKNYNSSVIFSPWLHERPQELLNDSYFRIFRDVEYLKSYFYKVKNLTLSIQNHGFVEKMQSQKPIIGYFFQKSDKKKIYIVGGNHRFNITRYFKPEFNFKIFAPNIYLSKKRDLIGTNLSRLGYHPNIFSFEEINYWPSVTSGFLTKKEAEKIFDIYFI